MEERKNRWDLLDGRCRLSCLKFKMADRERLVYQVRENCRVLAAPADFIREEWSQAGCYGLRGVETVFLSEFCILFE